MQNHNHAYTISRLREEESTHELITKFGPKKIIYFSEREQLLCYQSKNLDQDCKKIESLILSNSMFNMNNQQCPELSSSEFSLKALIPQCYFHPVFSYIAKSSSLFISAVTHCSDHYFLIYIYQLFAVERK